MADIFWDGVLANQQGKEVEIMESKGLGQAEQGCACEKGELCPTGCELWTAAIWNARDEGLYQRYSMHIRNCEVCKWLLEKEG